MDMGANLPKDTICKVIKTNYGEDFAGEIRAQDGVKNGSSIKICGGAIAI